MSFLKACSVADHAQDQALEEATHETDKDQKQQ